MSDDVVLSTRKVSKKFGGFTALNDVTIDFQKGNLTSIIGPNGAGKSTFFNVLTGGLKPSTGEIFFEGENITGLPQHEFARLGIAKSFQITTIFPSFTALENVRIALQSNVSRYDFFSKKESLHLEALALDLLATVGLRALATRLASELAHGQQRALEISIALALNPKLLLLDEPTAGMSPEETRVMMDLIVELAQQRTVVLVEHKMKMVMSISDRIVVLHHGELLAEGSADDIRQHDEVKRVYLGH